MTDCQWSGVCAHHQGRLGCAVLRSLSVSPADCRWPFHSSTLQSGFSSKAAVLSLPSVLELTLGGWGVLDDFGFWSAFGTGVTKSWNNFKVKMMT